MSDDREVDTTTSRRLHLHKVTSDELKSLEMPHKESVALTVTAEELKSLETERLYRKESEGEAANRLFKEHLVPVAASLVKTAIFGSNERVRLEAQKIVLDRVLGRVQDTPIEQERDPFKELLASCVRQLTPAEVTDTTAKKNIANSIGISIATESVAGRRPSGASAVEPEVQGRNVREGVTFQDNDNGGIE